MKMIFTAILATSVIGWAPRATTESTPPVTAPTIALDLTPDLNPDLSSVAMEKTDGCLTGPMEQFGRYIGDWDIETSSLSQTDGKTWSKGAGARWNFTCVGNGVAVQDFWMPEGGGVGTNLRIYDPKEKRWDIAWTATATPGFSHIRAQKDENGNIVMNYVSPPLTPPRRITFMPPTENGWNWKLEMQFPSGDTKIWREVFRIKASKHTDK